MLKHLAATNYRVEACFIFNFLSLLFQYPYAHLYQCSAMIKTPAFCLTTKPYSFRGAGWNTGTPVHRKSQDLCLGLLSGSQKPQGFPGSCMPFRVHINKDVLCQGKQSSALLHLPLLLSWANSPGCLCLLPAHSDPCVRTHTHTHSGRRLSGKPQHLEPDALINLIKT